MSAVFRWPEGGTGEVLRLSADAIALRSSVPWPPGARVEGTGEGNLPAKLRLKVHACRKQSSGDFLVEGRPLDLTRTDRERLERSLAAP